jgi:hypothetical protein
MCMIVIDLFFVFVAWNLKLLLLSCEYGEEMWCDSTKIVLFQLKKESKEAIVLGYNRHMYSNIWYAIIFVFSKIEPLWDTVEEYRMNSAFPLQEWLRERATILRRSTFPIFLSTTLMSFYSTTQADYNGIGNRTQYCIYN